jgi:cobalt-zinc-cadmium efflux system outer membrane protein
MTILGLFRDETDAGLWCRCRKACLAIFFLATISFGQDASPPIGLDDLVRTLDQKHPRLAQAALVIEAAHGQAIQAGRYPNPVFTLTGDEINDRTGTSGIWSPFFTQEIVRRDKRRLNIAAAQQTIQESTYAYHIERFVLLTLLRQRYFEVLSLQRRIELLREAVKAESQLAELARRLEQAGQTSRVELLNQQASLSRVQGDLQASESELGPAFRRLAATAAARQGHPQILAARVAIEKARLLLNRAEVESRPNFTLGAGYTWQSQNRSHDWGLSFSLPVPLWNRNQGNIRSARAELGRAVQEISRLEIELTDRIAEAHQRFVAAKGRVRVFRDEVVPRLSQSYELAAKAQATGQFDLFRVIVARRTLLEAQLESVKTQAEAWQAAAVLSGLMLEEVWPILPK